MAVVQWRRRRRSPLSILLCAGIIILLAALADAQHTLTPNSNFSLLSRRALGFPRQHILPYNMLLVLPQFESNNDKFGLTISKAKPVIDIAVEDVVTHGIMPQGWINISYHDSRYWEDTILAERWSTYGVVEAYCQKRLDAIFGFADSYSLATVAKVSAGFGDGLPVFTTAGLTAQLGSRKDFPFLTRMQGSYRQMADSIYQLIAYKNKNDTTVDDKPFNSSNLNYKHLSFFYHDKRRAFNKLRKYNDEQQLEQEASSHCYFSLYAIKQYFAEKSEFFKTAWQISAPAVAFDEELNRTTSEVHDWLQQVSTHSNGTFIFSSL
uniref:ANF_receptor domain-containing protein n=1 Tax=Panagrellus redivivus TaxID=6233 RepID=A0A7E4W5D8_PANRE